MESLKTDRKNRIIFSLRKGKIYWVTNKMQESNKKTEKAEYIQIKNLYVTKGYGWKN